MAAGRTPTPISQRTDADPDRRIARLVKTHGAALQRTARHFSLCADDAQDAYQRALEIYLRRLETIDAATEGAWMKVVVRNEALAVRRGRVESVAPEDLDLDTRADDRAPLVEDQLSSAERSARSAEVLRHLKPDEARALLLKAEGHSYAEIAEQNAWTYTNVVASLALFVALGGSAYAGVRLATNSVGTSQIRSRAVGPSELQTGAVSSRSVRNGSLRDVDLSNAARTALRGRTGSTGPAGPQGPVGPSGVTYKAAVDSAGGATAGNATRSRGFSNYFMIGFERDVTGCVATATLAKVPGGVISDPPPGRITVAPVEGEIRVNTFEADGTPRNLPFNLIVAC